jgi:hypothetical protein
VDDVSKTSEEVLPAKPVASEGKSRSTRRTDPFPPALGQTAAPTGDAEVEVEEPTAEVKVEELIQTGSEEKEL